MAKPLTANALKAKPAPIAAQPSIFGAPLAKARGAALAGEIYRLTPEALLKIWGAHYSADELHETVASERTLARRVAKREPLSAVETDRAIRLARVTAETERVFAESKKAARWLRSPNGELGERTPLSLLKSEADARAVEDTLIRIDHGIY